MPLDLRRHQREPHTNADAGKEAEHPKHGDIKRRMSAILSTVFLGIAFLVCLAFVFHCLGQGDYRKVTWWTFGAVMCASAGVAFQIDDWLVRNRRDTPTVDQSQRAWVVVKRITTPAVGVGLPLQIVITFINSGSSIARNVTSAPFSEPLPPGKEPAFSYAGLKRSGNAIMGPGIEMESRLDITKQRDGSLGALSHGDLTAIRNGQVIVFVHGRIDYEDAFGPHWTDFCNTLMIIQDPRRPSGLDAHWAPYKTHNDTDK